MDGHASAKELRSVLLEPTDEPADAAERGHANDGEMHAPAAAGTACSSDGVAAVTDEKPAASSGGALLCDTDGATVVGCSVNGADDGEDTMPLSPTTSSEPPPTPGQRARQAEAGSECILYAFVRVSVTAITFVTRHVCTQAHQALRWSLLLAPTGRLSR